MASTFAFGFGGDDIEDLEGVSDTDQKAPNVQGDKNDLIFDKAEMFSLEDMLASLPSQLEFNTQLIGSESEDPFLVARRELMDIRVQLMAERDMLNEGEDFLVGLQRDDIKPTVYEGGFKTWECALDLAALASHSQEGFTYLDNGDEITIIELGAGTAIPSLSLFRCFLKREEAGHRKVRFVLADYNATVLKLATLPNLLLTWYITRRGSPEGNNNIQTDPIVDHLLEIDRDLLESFVRDLSDHGITLSFISGGWSPEFVDLCLGKQEITEPETMSDHQQTTMGRRTLILASETIYSPPSLLPFTETLVSLMRKALSVEGSSIAQGHPPVRALISAKKVYFGVGGGVSEFLSTLRDVGGSEEFKALTKLTISDAGVTRTVLEILPGNGLA
ncbi:mitotic exit network interactor 1 [Trichophyton equinum CBS 127.97]|uniref:protein-histidine N-methyltransferase n=1 Tax=Trichophyton equinum (strain ATCC MYA-4606 / CBS 127.97) TaxID=559882 RepID=F2PGV2_TRIEC|nr:mitotic exit network interactor 1 [Trichophyton equinum CBS 127.97]